MTESGNPLAWFEIPVLDLERARRFHEHLLGVELELHAIDEDGARILLQKTPFATHGFVGFFEDCEGNRVGLYSKTWAYRRFG